jgi:hypothetical protein
VLLIPTLDIALCWLCHVLHDTTRYYADLSAAGGISCVHLPSLSDPEMWCYSEALKATERLWLERFPKSPYLPHGAKASEVAHQFYHILFTAGMSTERLTEYVSRPDSYYPSIAPPPHADDVARLPIELSQISFCADDLEHGLKWLTDFYEKEYFDQFEKSCTFNHSANNERAMEHLVETYERFLWLVRKYPDDNFVPSGLCRFLWMAHQLDADSYKTWTTTVLGQHMLHAMKRATLARDCDSTKELDVPTLQSRWKEEFGVSHFEDHAYQNTTVLIAFDDFDTALDGHPMSFLELGDEI